MFSALARPGQRSDLLPVWVVLALLALVLRAALPAGWMPVQSDGSVALVLCSGNGTQAVEVDLGKAPVDHSPDGAQPCAFAATGSPLLDANPGPLRAPDVATVAADGPPSSWIDPRAGPAWQTPPSLGP